MPPALHGSSASKQQLLESPTSQVCLKKIIKLSSQISNKISLLNTNLEAR
jgi:hypothetical protein